jgi:hypothetical protein
MRSTHGEDGLITSNALRLSISDLRHLERGLSKLKPSNVISIVGERYAYDAYAGASRVAAAIRGEIPHKSVLKDTEESQVVTIPVIMHSDLHVALMKYLLRLKREHAESLELLEEDASLYLNACYSLQLQLSSSFIDNPVQSWEP